MSSDSFTFQELETSDEPFLWEMFYQSIYVSPDEPPLSRDVLSLPEIAMYVANWGLEGDLGFKAIHEIDKTPVGAIWVRQFKEKNKGYGYVDDDTPEIAMAVEKAFRNQGIGFALLETLFCQLRKDGVKSVSLSVSLANPARNLYKRLGFSDIGHVYDESITMIRSLRPT